MDSRAERPKGPLWQTIELTPQIQTLAKEFRDSLTPHPPYTTLNKPGRVGVLLCDNVTKTVPLHQILTAGGYITSEDDPRSIDELMDQYKQPLKMLFTPLRNQLSRLRGRLGIYHYPLARSYTLQPLLEPGIDYLPLNLANTTNLPEAFLTGYFRLHRIRINKPDDWTLETLLERKQYLVLEKLLEPHRKNKADEIVTNSALYVARDPSIAGSLDIQAKRQKADRNLRHDLSEIKKRATLVNTEVVIKTQSGVGRVLKDIRAY